MRTTTLAPLLVVVVLAGCSRLIGTTPSTPAQPMTARAELVTSTGQPAGTASLTETPHGVLITAQLSGLPPGMHAIHFHETGQCEPPFTTAGGHFNPANRLHGFRRDQGPHAGDLPNIRVADNGTAQLELFTALVSLSAGPNSLLDADGTAVVVHAGADDHFTDPSGNSGSRIACGVVTR